MSTGSTEKNTIVTRLSVMMFIQFFVWGAWFTSLAACLVNNNIGDAAAGAYGSAPIAAIIAPLFLGLIADRFFASEAVMGVLMILGGVFMCAVPHYALAGDVSTVVWLFTFHMLCYMPTLGLSNTIAFSHIPSQNDFPKIRVWGTIGWIIAGLVVGFMGWSLSVNMFWVAGVSSLIFGVYSFTLPHTPPPAKGEKADLRNLLMVDALKLLSKPNFFVFILCSTLICIPLAYYYGITSNYLTTVGFEQPASTMTLGQMSEIVFMILIPFFLRHLGVKWMILVGMLAWVARYALFAMAAPEQVIWMIYLAIILHGICYDFFFVTGFIYTDKKAPREIRGQAQSMLVFFTQGVGMYFGYWIAFARQDSTVPSLPDLQSAIAAARPEETLTFAEKLTKMFAVNLPEVDTTLLAQTMDQWQTFWWVPTGMAGVIAAIFFLSFWDRVEVEPTPDEDPAQAVPDVESVQ